MCTMVYSSPLLYYSTYNSVSARLSDLGWGSVDYRRYENRLATCLRNIMVFLQNQCLYIDHPSRFTQKIHTLVSARYMFLLTIAGLCLTLLNGFLICAAVLANLTSLKNSGEL